MASKQQQGQQTQQQPQPSAPPPQRQMQQQTAAAPASQSQSQSGGARQAYDPLGRPLHQTSPRFTDQQAGGDMSGNTADARDDNYAATGGGQNTRDVSAHAQKLPAVSAELLRSTAIAPTVEPGSRPPVGQQHAAAEPQADGSEDPGANADDGLAPRKHDGTAGEQH